MKIVCPKCKAPIPPDAVNVAKALVYCSSCREGFALDQLLEHEIVPVERPQDGKSLLIREDGRLALSLPAGAARSMGCFFLFFSAFWNAITWTFVAMGIGMQVGYTTPTPGGLSPIFLLLFMTPFVAIGLVTAAIALFCLFGEITLAMDREQLIFRRRLFGRNWDTTHPLNKIKKITRAVAYEQNDRPVYGVGIEVTGASTVTFGSGLKEDEQRWLIYELHTFWQENKSD